jgi:hypothetical protein
LDTNTWRYLVDADAIDQLRNAARRFRVDIVACPAVVYECLHAGDPTLRRALAKALARPEWVRPMPEAYVYCERLRAAIAVHRPHWLHPNPNLKDWYRQRSDWAGPFWRRVREQPHRMGKIVTALGGERLENARAESTQVRERAAAAKVTSSSIDFGETVELVAGSPGWDGEPFAVWRYISMTRWWDDLVRGRHQTMLDWLGPWVDRRAIALDVAGWNAFWTREVSAAELPHEWLHWGMSAVQATRKNSDGTPVDNQITSYLPDYDYFVTSDRVFVDCVRLINEHSPIRLAAPLRTPGGNAAVAHILEILETVSSGSRPTDG